MRLVRRTCKSSMSLVSYLHLNCEISGTDLEDPENGIRNANKDVDSAYSRYEGKINDIVRCDHDKFCSVF